MRLIAVAVALLVLAPALGNQSNVDTRNGDIGDGGHDTAPATKDSGEADTFLSSVLRAGMYFALLLGAFVNVILNWSVWYATGWRRVCLAALPFALMAW
jgi:hypothetical protein